MSKGMRSFFSARLWMGVSAAAVLCGAAGCVTTETTQLSGTGGIPDTNMAAATRAPVDNQKRYEARLQLAVAYYQAGAYSVALDDVNKALEAKPNAPEAISLKGMIYDQMGDKAQGLAFLRQAASIDKSNGDYLHNYGAALCSNKQTSEGIASLQQAIAIPSYPNKASSWAAIGACYAEAGNVVQAENAFHQALSLDPRNVYALYQLSNFMFNRNDVQGAKYYFDQLPGLNNLNSAALWLGIKIARQQGDAYRMSQMARVLRANFPASKERAALERGDFTL